MTNNPEICTQPDNFTCCKGDKCLTGDWNCKQGTKLVFAGCNSECNPEAECQEINTGFFQKFINWFKNLFS
jgi:hypothetical protein